MMSAGSGVIHSEFNGSDREPVHLLQIWIEPAVTDVEPSYHQMSFDPQEKCGRFRILSAPKESGHHDAALMHQDVSIYAAMLGPGESLSRTIAPERHAWVQVASGNVSVNGEALGEGDGAAVSGERDFSFTGGPGGSEFLFFDLA
jgi:redox-sensitive bicupin YhaK (pirin superfamily)